MAFSVGEKMNAVREARDLTQTEVAEMLGVNRAHISKIETGKANPSAQLVKLFCKTFSIPQDWLLSGEDGLPDYQETINSIADSFKENILNVSLGYLTILEVEIGFALERIHLAESEASSYGSPNLTEFFQDSETKPVRVPLNHPMRQSFEGLIRDINEKIDTLNFQKKKVERKIFFSNVEIDGVD